MFVPDPLSVKEPCGPAVTETGSKARLVLPAADIERWSSRRKAAVVVAMRTGVITREEACERYKLSDEELAGWEAAFDQRGIPGLRVAGLRPYQATAAPPALRS